MVLAIGVRPALIFSKHPKYQLIACLVPRKKLTVSVDGKLAQSPASGVNLAYLTTFGSVQHPINVLVWTNQSLLISQVTR